MSLARDYEPDDDYAPSDWGLACTKRPYPSIQNARRRTRNVSNRIRVYYCEDCRAFHCTNGEKR